MDAALTATAITARGTQAARELAETSADELQSTLDKPKPTASPTWLNWLTGK